MPRLVRRPVRALAPVALALAAACGTGTGDINQDPPVSVTYSNPAPVYTACTPITPNLPSVVGLVGSYSMVPPPPAGLVFDTKTGVLTGTPTAPQSATDFGITATNNVGSVATVITIAVQDAPPPTGLTYAQSPVAYLLGEAITPNTPSFGGTASQFSVAPPLPAGLTLNPTTGVITGTPTTAVLETEFTVTATNCVGAMTTGTVRIEVVDPEVPTVPNLLFVANEGDDTVSVLGVNPVDGKLRSLRWERVGNAPVDLVGATNGQTLYVLHRSAGNLGAYAVEAKTGRLTQLPSSPYGLPVLGAPEAVALSPDGERLYVANTGDDSISGFTVGESGALTVIAGSPFAVTGDEPAALVVHPDGTHLYVAGRGSDSVSIFAIGSGTGALTDAGTLAGLDQPGSLATLTLTPGEHALYVGEQGPSNQVTPFTIEPDGTLTAGTPVGLTAGGGSGGPRALATAVVDGSNYLYVANANADRVERLPVDAAGQPSAPTAFADGPYDGGAPEDLALNTSRTLLFTVFADDVEASSARIDLGTGDLAAVAPVESPTDRMRVRSTPSAIALVNGITAPVHETDAIYATSTLNALPDLSRVVSRAYDYSASLGPADSEFAGNTTNWVEVHPYLDFCWVAAELDTIGVDIQGYPLAADGSVQPSTYQLEIGTVVTGTQGMWSLHVEPSGRYLYGVRTAADSQVIPFSIADTGDLAPGAAVTIGSGAREAAIDPTGRFVYVPNQLSGTVSQLRIDPTNGALSPIAGPIAAGGSPFAVTVDPTGRFCYVADRAAGTPGVRMYSIDAVTGALSPLTTPTLAIPGSFLSDVAFGPQGRFLFVGDETAGAPLRRYEVNLDPDDFTDDGTLQPPAGGAETPGVGQIRAMRLDATGTRLFLVVSGQAGATGTWQTYTIDPTNDGAAVLQVGVDVVDGQRIGARGVGSRDRIQ